MFQELLNYKNSLLVKAAYDNFCTALGITEEEKLLINIEEVKRLDAGTSGTCAGTYERGGTLKKIDIKLLHYASTFGVIDVLAHELVHARQHLRGEFTFGMVKKKIFFGLLEVDVVEKYHAGQPQSTTPYYDRVCEREAHLKSYELMTNFCAILDERLKEERAKGELEDGEDGDLGDEDSTAEDGVQESGIEEGSILGLS